MSHPPRHLVVDPLAPADGGAASPACPGIGAGSAPLAGGPDALPGCVLDAFGALA